MDDSFLINVSETRGSIFIKVLQHSFLEKKHQRAVLPETWKHNSHNDFNVSLIEIENGKKTKTFWNCWDH